MGGISSGLLTPEQEASLAARKTALHGSNLTYFEQHPEFRALLTDFLESCVQQEPDDVTQFAATYFCDSTTRRREINERT